MQIIPVLDLAGGVAVHARAGERSRYAPLHSDLVPDRVGDALALLQAFHAALHVQECYVADLDAIQGGAIQHTRIRELAEFHAGSDGALMVDAGVSRPGAALEVLSTGASQVIVGLESLPAFADLAAIIQVVTPPRVVFSLDLKLGSPVLHPALQDTPEARSDAMALAGQAVEAGVTTILLLDLGRVGTGCGVDLVLLEALRQRFPRIRLLAGGGVLTRLDLERMRDTGCDGALVASALHSGRVTAADVAALSQSMWSGQSGTRASW